MTPTSVNTGSKIISEVEIDIGGQRIDKHFNEWILLWNELTTPASKQAGLKYLIGDAANRTTNVIIPLTFWFCHNPGLALPLIALQYHEVKLWFTWGTSTEVGATAVVSVWCNYIFLDTDERRRMAQNPHEYLINQVQQQTGSTITSSLQLNFNHPVKELIFTLPDRDTFNNDVKCNLKLNGQYRFSPQVAEYFQVLQPLEYHTAIPGTNFPNAIEAFTSKLTSVINVYSFSLRPEEHQPSGTCNFSRIDSATLNFTSAVPVNNIYAVNYNVLRIMSGMGGLAYSN